MRRAAEVRAASTEVAAAAEVRASTEMSASARVATATGVRTTAMLCEKGSRESRGRQNQRYGDQTGHRVKCTTVFGCQSCRITSTFPGPIRSFVRSSCPPCSRALLVTCMR